MVATSPKRTYVCKFRWAFDLPVPRRFPEIGKVDWRGVDFTRFSKTRNPAVTRYTFTPDAVLRQLEATH